MAAYLCVLSFQLGCSDASFMASGHNAGKEPTLDEPRRPGDDARPKPEDPKAPGPSIIASDGQISHCPPRPQKILILDFKSGWWSGDGGQFFTKILGHLAERCPQQVRIAYHHILKSGAAHLNGLKNEMVVVPGGQSLIEVGTDFYHGAFSETDWNHYQQIWVLSGSHADLDDIRTSNPFFVTIMDRITQSQANLFIAAGYGSITHSNAVTERLGWGAFFGTSQPEGRLLDPMRGVSILSHVPEAQIKSDHLLFGRGAQGFADLVRVHRNEAGGDYITNQPQITHLATDNQGQTTIGIAKINSRHVVIDAGLQRYYAIWQSADAATLALIQNILVYLSQSP